MKVLLAYFGLVFGLSAQLVSGTISSGTLVSAVPPPPPFTPTNISGFPSLAWWVGDNAIATSSNTVGTWTDAYTNHWNLTNLDNAIGWPFKTNSVLNGHAVVTFSNNQYLVSLNYTSSQPHEVMIVLRVQGTASVGLDVGVHDIMTPSFADPPFGLYAHQFAWAGNTDGPETDLLAGSAAFVSVTPRLGIFQVINLVFTNGSSQVITNNVQWFSGNAGNSTCSSLRFGDASDISTFFSLAEVATYKTNLSTAARTALFNYETNKYGLSPLP